MILVLVWIGMVSSKTAGQLNLEDRGAARFNGDATHADYSLVIKRPQYLTKKTAHDPVHSMNQMWLDAGK